jgi:hypothetical protein
MSGVLYKTVNGVRVAMSDEEQEATLAAWAAAEAAPAPVPISVTPLQMRKALRMTGLKAQADAYLATLDEQAQEAWEYAIEIRIDDPFIEGARVALGMTEAEANDLFRLAASL